jgi:thiamine biosynthesis lipoprotein
MSASPMTAAFRRVEPVMGTVVTFDVRDPGHEPHELDPAVALLHDVDARFSTYRPDSEISRLGRGELTLEDCSPDVRHVMAFAEDLRRTSHGVFDIVRHRPDGRLDPSGVVKGWAVEEAGWLVDDTGIANYCINAGGDIVVRGEAAPGRPWRVGIRHPDRADRVAAVLVVGGAAVATSGAYERGDHIVDPRGGRAPGQLTSVTVVGPSLTYADAYATTAFAMGMEGLAWVAERPGYGAFGITPDGRVLWTPEVDGLLA